jgi:hypothetical protein
VCRSRVLFSRDHQCRQIQAMLLWRSRILRAFGVVIGREHHAGMLVPESQVQVSPRAIPVRMTRVGVNIGAPSAMVVPNDPRSPSAQVTPEGPRVPRCPAPRKLP